MIRHADVETDCAKLRSALASYLMPRFNCRTDPVHFGLSPGTIHASRKAFDIYLRVMHDGASRWPDKTIVVARIGFNQPRRGHGASLISFLAHWASAFGFRYLAIEQPNEGCALFAAKLGFSKIEKYSALVAAVKAIPMRRDDSFSIQLKTTLRPN